MGQFAFSQIPADSLNKRNAKNKKHGFRKVYLSEQLIGIKDSSKAYYYSYDYYDNGHLVIYAGSAPRYKKKTIKVNMSKASKAAKNVLKKLRINQIFNERQK